MSAYADTSFLDSLYVLDTNSALAAERMKRARLPILITPFVELELTNAVSLRVFRRKILRSHAKASLALLRQDIAGGVLLTQPLPQNTLDRARQISRRRTPQLGTRTLDVLHVASALLLRAEAFYTFDQNQIKLAKAEGLFVA